GDPRGDRALRPARARRGGGLRPADGRLPPPRTVDVSLSRRHRRAAPLLPRGGRPGAAGRAELGWFAPRGGRDRGRGAPAGGPPGLPGRRLGGRQDGAGAPAPRGGPPRMTERVIVVAKRSSYSRLTTGDVDQRAKVLLRRGDPAVRKWKPAHEAHVRTLEKVREALDSLGVEALVLHGSHASFEPRGVSLVVTVGGDGTLLAASHSVHDVPILGVNSAPRYSVGFFCAARAQGIRKTLADALEGRLPETRFSRMAVSVNGQVRSERVLNEALFCHAVPAATSNYILQVGRMKEEQRSSG